MKKTWIQKSRDTFPLRNCSPKCLVALTTIPKSTYSKQTKVQCGIFGPCGIGGAADEAVYRTVIHFVSISAKFSRVEGHMGHLLKLIHAHSSSQSAYFSFNKCPIYTHNGANDTFSTNWYETDYSAYIGTITFINRNRKRRWYGQEYGKCGSCCGEC